MSFPNKICGSEEMICPEVPFSLRIRISNYCGFASRQQQTRPHIFMDAQFLNQQWVGEQAIILVSHLQAVAFYRVRYVSTFN
jgi:hypothetical protein